MVYEPIYKPYLFLRTGKMQLEKVCRRDRQELSVVTLLCYVRNILSIGFHLRAISCRGSSCQNEQSFTLFSLNVHTSIICSPLKINGNSE